MTFARESWPFVTPFALLALVLMWQGFFGWAFACGLLALALLLFFRDPVRTFDGPASVVLAAGEGVITAIDQIEAPDVGPGTYHRIVTFLSVFNVHVQRVPCDGKVVHSSSRDGRKRAAFHPDIDRDNASHLTVIERPSGERVGVRQIVGLLARRVVCYLDTGREVRRGELLGLIKFGSRVDLVVPAHYEVLVTKGQKVRNGETPMARPPAQAASATGPS